MGFIEVSPDNVVIDVEFPTTAKKIAGVNIDYNVNMINKVIVVASFGQIASYIFLANMPVTVDKLTVALKVTSEVHCTQIVGFSNLEREWPVHRIVGLKLIKALVSIIVGSGEIKHLNEVVFMKVVYRASLHTIFAFCIGVVAVNILAPFQEVVANQFNLLLNHLPFPQSKNQNPELA